MDDRAVATLADLLLSLKDIIQFTLNSTECRMRFPLLSCLSRWAVTSRHCNHSSFRPIATSSPATGTWKPGKGTVEH